MVFAALSESIEFANGLLVRTDYEGIDHQD